MSATKYAHYDSIPEEWWAYFGGLFTGEGCIYLGDDLAPCLQMEVCDYAVVRGVYKKLGGHFRCRGIRESRNRVHLAKAYEWRISGLGDIVHILRKITPYVHGRKGKQAQALLRFTLLKLAFQTKKAHEKRQRYTVLERLQLVQTGRAVRDFAGGGSKGWKPRWTRMERQLKKELDRCKRADIQQNIKDYTLPGVMAGKAVKLVTPST